MPQHASAVTGETELPFAVSAPISFYALRRVLLVALAAVFAMSLLAAAPAPAARAAGSEAGMIAYDAKDQLGKPWVAGATGMRSYDCSGLVYRMFEMNGLLNRIGGSRRTVRGYFNWFRDRGLVSRRNPRVGDLIVWGDNKHIGIYMGDGKAISTLVSGVKRHGVFGLTIGFKAYLHVNLER